MTEFYDSFTTQIFSLKNHNFEVLILKFYIYIKKKTKKKKQGNDTTKHHPRVTFKRG